jgi:hypothetical protein
LRLLLLLLWCVCLRWLLLLLLHKKLLIVCWYRLSGVIGTSSGSLHSGKTLITEMANAMQVFLQVAQAAAANLMLSLPEHLTGIAGKGHYVI